MLDNIKKTVSIISKAYIIYIISCALIPILIMVLLFTLGVISDFFCRTTKISEEGQKELLEWLEINDAPSFKFLKIESYDTDTRDENMEKVYGLRLKFEISKEDYEKNGLEYYDCSDGSDWGWTHYISKIKDNTYTCGVSSTDVHTKEIYEKIKHIRDDYCLK